MIRFLIRRHRSRAPRHVAHLAGRVRPLLRGANNVARTLAGRQATPETVALISPRLGLDQPMWKQYLDFLGKALHGDLGYDYYHQVPVTTIIGAGAADHAVASSLGGAIIWLVMGVFNGVVSAIRPRSLHRPRPDGRSRCSSTRCRRSCSACCCSTSSTSGSPWPGYPVFPAGGYAPLAQGLGAGRST